MRTSAGFDLTFTDVKYMPEGDHCILSPGALISKCAHANFYNGGVDIMFNNKCIIQGQQVGNLYFTWTKPQLKLSVNWKVIATSTDLETWHFHMGHMSKQALKRSDLSDAVHGLSIPTYQEADRLCHWCELVKSHRLPFPPSSKRAKEPVEIVHSDSVGPFGTFSLQGHKYFTTFIDNYSHTAVVTCMKTKDQFKQAFTD
jgi:hypothetical protein